MTTIADDPPAAPRRPSLGLRFVVAFLLGIVLVAGVGGGALYAYEQQYAGRILPGVHVGDADLSGLSPAAARRVLADHYASFSGGRVALTGPTGELTIGYAEIGRRPDVDAMLAAALVAGREGERMADLLSGPQTAIRGVTITPLVTYDTAKLQAAVDAVAEAVDLLPTNATLTRDDDNTFRVTLSKPGRVVDREGLLASIAGVVARLDAPGELALKIPIVQGEPIITTSDAAAARVAAERMAADLVLKDGKESWTIPGKKLRALISFSPTIDGSITPIVDVAGIDPLLKSVAKAVNRKAKDASYLVSRGGRIIGVQAGHNGRSLNVASTRALVVDALMARQAGNPEPELAPVIATTRPALSTEDAEKSAPLMKRISKWTTYFPIGEKNGFGANIWIPAKLINGYVVGPGETFDFWKAVGPVTREKGFRQGGAIINGKTEPQGAFAGGICSCSTTLFNAALRGGFKMGARRNHYYYIDRYPLGLDATVLISASGSKQTMSWTNDTKYPVLIRGINTRSGSRGFVTFELYSVPGHRKVVIGNPTVKNVRPAGDTTVYTSGLPKGATQRIEYPVDGKDVWRTVTVYEGGKILRSTTYYSHYSRITGILLVGTGGGASSSPTP